MKQQVLASLKSPDRLISRLTPSLSGSAVISGPVVVLPFKVSSTGPAIWLPKGISKYKMGLERSVSNVIRQDSPIATVIEAAPLVIAMTETTSLAPHAAVSEPPWPHTAPVITFSSASPKGTGNRELTIITPALR